MIQDRVLFYSLEQAVTTSAASTNSLNLGLGDAGIAEGLFLYVQTTETFTSVATPTLTIDLETSSDDTTFTKTGVSVSVTLANLGVNKRLAVIALPIGLKKFTRVYYTVANGSFTAGKLSAMLVDGINAQQYLATTVPGVK
jgi:hypothetical protein